MQALHSLSLHEELQLHLATLCTISDLELQVFDAVLQSLRVTAGG